MLAFSLPSPLLCWSFSGIISDATQSISSYFSTQNTQSSSKEYVMGLHTPITLNNQNGAIKVTSWNKPALMVEAIKRGSDEEIENTTFSVSVQEDMVTITTETLNDQQKTAAIDYTLIIPRTAPLNIRSNSGNITLYESNANIDLQTLRGSIKIENATKSIRAQAPRGEVTIEQPEFSRDGSIFVEAERNISLVLPENANALVHAHAPQGKIYSEIYVTLDPITTKLDKDAYKLLQHSIRGTMGAGGAPVTLESTRGSITILGS